MNSVSPPADIAAIGICGGVLASLPLRVAVSARVRPAILRTAPTTSAIWT